MRWNTQSWIDKLNITILISNYGIHYYDLISIKDRNKVYSGVIKTPKGLGIDLFIKCYCDN